MRRTYRSHVYEYERFHIDDAAVLVGFGHGYTGDGFA